MTKNTKIKIAYIDDDIDVIYGPLKDIEDEILRMADSDLEIKVSFVDIRNELTEEDFWDKLLENNFQGIILDYKLVDSKIFRNADVMWKKIKLNNPLFPLAIYTSHLEEVTFDKKNVSIFEKGDYDQTKRMIDYLITQINRSIETIEELKRTNAGLKDDQDISYAVLKNEEEIENQFSLFYKRERNEEDEQKFRELMDYAFNIINKYDERTDD